VQGLVTPLDVLEAIAGEFPDEDETPDVVVDGDGWIAKGGTDLHLLQQTLDTYELVSPTDDYASLAGLLLAQSGQMPEVGEIIEIPPLKFEIIELAEYRIERVKITKMKSDNDWHDAD
jgi:CBS domain containing-hemolysin-like protein